MSGVFELRGVGGWVWVDGDIHVTNIFTKGYRQLYYDKDAFGRSQRKTDVLESRSSVVELLLIYKTSSLTAISDGHINRWTK